MGLGALDLGCALVPCGHVGGHWIGDGVQPLGVVSQTDPTRCRFACLVAGGSLGMARLLPALDRPRGMGVTLLSIQLAAVLLAWSWTMVPLGRDQARQWVFGSAATALTILLGWGAWQQLQGEALEGRDWTPWMSHIRLAMFAALGVVWGSRGIPRAWVWAFLALWGTFTAVTGSFTSALLWPLSLLWLMAQEASPQTRRTLTGVRSRIRNRGTWRGGMVAPTHPRGQGIPAHPHRPWPSLHPSP